MAKAIKIQAQYGVVDPDDSTLSMFEFFFDFVDVVVAFVVEILGIVVGANVVVGNKVVGAEEAVVGVCVD